MTLDIDTTRRLVFAALRAAFPDPFVDITEEAVSLAIGAMRSVWTPEIGAAFGIDKPEEVSEADRVDEAFGTDRAHRGVSYYLARATHTRFREVERQEATREVYHSFTALLPHVRVALPETGEAEIQTQCGTVYPGDHLLHNVAMVNVYLADQAKILGKEWEADHVELLTPPRFAGARFGAIAVYVLYSTDRSGPMPRAPEVYPRVPDAQPTRAAWGYILEAGMATGEPRTLYFSGGSRDPIVRRSYYKPTPDSASHHFYRGRFDFLNPTPTLTVEAFRLSPLKGDLPYHETRVVYEQVDHVQTMFPALLTLQAAARVALIEQSMGRELPGVGAIGTAALAALARTLPWDVEPGSTGSIENEEKP